MLRGLAGASIALAGCGSSGSGSPDDADIIAGPDSRLVFEPGTLTVSVGETVTWYFASRGHNVCGVPDHHDTVSIPESADPFSSYEGDDAHRTAAAGTTYSHTVETAGEYRYVCLPHAPEMRGQLCVEG